MKRCLQTMTLSIWLLTGVLNPFFSARAQVGDGAGALNAGEVRAVFLNVGKADAALITLGGRHYLIDTGTKDSGVVMLRALAYYRVDTLAGVFITHTDSDHVGGLKTLLKSEIAVEHLYAPSFYNVKSLEKHPVYRQAEKYALPLTWLTSGDMVIVDDTAHFAVLGPISRDEMNENNNSLVLRLITPQGDMLLAADMEVQEEQALLSAGLLEEALVLKVGHHGDGDASSEGFLYTVRPQIAVISTNMLEEPDTPDPAVMGRLWNIGAEVFVTQKATLGVMVTLTGGNAVGKLVNDAAQ